MEYEYKFKVTYFAPTGHDGDVRAEYFEIKAKDTDEAEAACYMEAMKRAIEMKKVYENIDSVELMGKR
jgi:hypothetical protein